MRLKHFSLFVWVLMALSFLGLSPETAFAQQRSNSVGGFGAFSLSGASDARTGFGGNVAFDLTPNIQAIGEVGRIGNVLPATSSALLSFAPFDVGVSAFYGEGGVRYLASPGATVTPYAEATAGIARLRTRLSDLDSTLGAIVGGALTFLDETKPIAGVGGGVLVRGGPVLVDVGYRYKQVLGGASGIASVLSLGQELRSHQVRVGVGVRF